MALRGAGGAGRCGRSAASGDLGTMVERGAPAGRRFAGEITGPANIEEHFLVAAHEWLDRDEEITAIVRGPDGARLVGTTRQLLLLHHDGVGGIVAESWPLDEIENVAVVGDYVLVTIRSRPAPISFVIDPDVQEPDLQAVTVINLERARVQAQTSGRSRATNLP